jgi:hydroxypyruvate isomerase
MRRRDFIRTGGSAVALAGLAAAQSKPPRNAKITSSVMLWTLKGTTEQRIEAAAKAGMQSIELVAEHVQWSDSDTVRYKKLIRSFGMDIDTIIAQPDWKKRSVSMVDPAQRENFLKDIKQAIVYAHKLDVPYIIVMSTDSIAGRTHEEQYASMLEGAKRACEFAAKADVTLIVEPLNDKKDHKGFFLTNCTEGTKLVKEVDNPHVRLLFDIYHEQVQAGNVIGTLTEAAPYTSVFHVADSPGRNDPGLGEIHYTNVYKAIAKTGFSGYITMEYIPSGEQVASLIKSVDQMRAALAG